MTDFIGKILNVGDKVVVMHKRYPTTTYTMKQGVVIRVTDKRAQVAVEGMNSTTHSSKTIVKI